MITQDERHLVLAFEFSHLPPHLAEVSKRFAATMADILAMVPPGPFRRQALEFLLLAKGAAVRAVATSTHTTGVEDGGVGDRVQTSTDNAGGL